MADYPDARPTMPAFGTAGRASPPYNQTNTTLNVADRGTSMAIPAMIAVAVFAIAGVVGWRVLDGDVTIAPMPATQTTVPETITPAQPGTAPVQPAPDLTPPAIPAGDPAPGTPPVGDPPATPSETPPTAAPSN